MRCTALVLYAVLVKHDAYFVRDEAFPVVAYKEVDVIAEFCCEGEERVNGIC